MQETALFFFLAFCGSLDLLAKGPGSERGDAASSVIASKVGSGPTRDAWIGDGQIFEDLEHSKRIPSDIVL